MNNSQAKDATQPKRELTDAELEQVKQSLRGLLFGSVSILVQDGVIVQIDRTEKRRLRGNRVTQRPASEPQGGAAVT